METWLEPLLGPLAAIECRRAVSRAWVLVIRALAALPPALVLLAVLWLWWFEEEINPGYSPGRALVWGVVVVEAMFVTVALLLCQALLAGTLAGEKLRSTAMLLAAQVSSAEIVLGRLAGRLCVVAIVLAAGLPILVGLAAMNGLGSVGLAALVALPAAVAFGGGGLALAVSAVTRSGRDALLVVYLFEVLFLLAPLTGRFLPQVGPWIEPLNPYQAILPLAEREDLGPALATMGQWAVLGAAGCAWAAWRLRPAFLSAADGRRRWRRPLRLSRVPILADRPMLWKELYVEQAQAFGRLVKWLGILVVAIFCGGSIVLTGLVAWAAWLEPDSEWSDWALAYLTEWLGWSWLMAWLIQWAVGLRAAAAITSERQRGTWDALLASPLESREILWAKIFGSIYGLRGLLIAVVVAWTAGLMCGALTARAYTELLGQTLAIGGFMVAIGIAFSLHSESSTRAMTGTILSWLGAGCVFAILAGIVTMMAMLVWVFWNLWHGKMAPGPGPGPWLAMVYYGTRLAFYGLAAVLTAAYVQSRFDHLAGRSVASDPNVSLRPLRATS